MQYIVDSVIITIANEKISCKEFIRSNQLTLLDFSTLVMKDKCWHFQGLVIADIVQCIQYDSEMKKYLTSSTNQVSSTSGLIPLLCSIDALSWNIRHNIRSHQLFLKQQNASETGQYDSHVSLDEVNLVSGFPAPLLPQRLHNEITLSKGDIKQPIQYSRSFIQFLASKMIIFQRIESIVHSIHLKFTTIIQSSLFSGFFTTNADQRLYKSIVSLNSYVQIIHAIALLTLECKKANTVSNENLSQILRTFQDLSISLSLLGGINTFSMINQSTGNFNVELDRMQRQEQEMINASVYLKNHKGFNLKDNSSIASSVFQIIYYLFSINPSPIIRLQDLESTSSASNMYLLDALRFRLNQAIAMFPSSN
jgi:hypothetical protein